MPDNILPRTFNLDALPTLPSVAMEAIKLMDGQSSTFDSLALLLKNDQVLSGKILRYANSAHVGARREITTIAQAIAALGMNAVRAIVLSVSIFDSFSPEANAQRQLLVRFWLHSIGVAATAETLARLLGFPSPDEAYLCGLIHDLGKLVIFQQFPEAFERVCREIEKPLSDPQNHPLPLESEQLIAGCDHIDIGRLIGERYGFPDLLTRCMWFHHQPVVDTIIPVQDNLPLLVRFADVLCVTHHVGSSYFLTERPVCHPAFHFALENLTRLHNLSAKDLSELMEVVHGRVEEVSSILGCWDEKQYHELIGTATSGLGRMSLELDESNLEFAATNQMLSITCDMYRRLNNEVGVGEAARIICSAACQAFEVERSLCLIRDPDEQRFVGGMIEAGLFHDMELPSTLAAMGRQTGYGANELEIEAAKRLEEVTHDLVHGHMDDSRLQSIIFGSKFLATFFLADKNSRWRKEPLLGQLLLDFSSGPDFIRGGAGGLKKNFEAFALAACSAIQRLLLQHALNRQIKNLAEATRKMEQKQQQLFHSHRLATVGHLAYGASHEINNPLTVISLNLQLLRRLLPEQEEPDEPRKRLEIISSQVDRIAMVVNDLMSFARPTEPKFGPASLTKVVANALRLLERREARENITIDNRIGDNLPLVLIDAQQVEQVFLNLFINGCQAMDQGGLLTLEASHGNGFVEVRVRDTGHGIAAKDLGKIFDPFFTTRMEGEGSGLGLAVCHTIIEHNKGDLRVESDEGYGTTFILRLPVDKSDRLRQMKNILKTRKNEEQSDDGESGYRILVVDDEQSLNSVVQETLRAVGYSVDGAYDGVEGLEKLRQERFHVVLLDLRMPRKDGLAVLNFIKQHYPAVEVIIITGHASMKEIQETAQKGAFACLKKPFMLDKLLDTISRAIKKQEARDTKA